MSEINSSTTLNLSSSTDVVTVLDTSSGFTAQLDTSLLTANRVITFPDTNGTISVGGAMAIGGTVTGGTTGSILFIGAGPILSQDSANLVYDDATNRVGIGTNAPSTDLHISSTAPSISLQDTNDLVGTMLTNVLFKDSAGTQQGFVGFGNADGTVTLANTSANGLRLMTTNLTRLFIDSAGLVGIGTTTPNQQLEITANFRLPASTSTTGIIFSGANRYIHNFGTNNFFAGTNAGNLTLTGNSHVGIGDGALTALTTGSGNTAIGNDALIDCTTGQVNVAIGNLALQNLVDGSNNVAVGNQTLNSSISGIQNVAIGYTSLFVSTGNQNIAIGYQAGDNLTTGNRGVILGFNIDFPSATTDNQLNIGNIIFGTGVSGTGTTIAGDIGIGVNAPASKLHVYQATLGNEVFRMESTASNDDPSERVVQNKVLTTNATATTIHTFAIPASTTVQVKAWVTARRTGGAAGTAEDGAGYETMSTWKNVAGTATQIGATATTQQEDVAGWGVSFAGSGANALLQVSGAVNTNISWIVTARTYTIST